MLGEITPVQAELILKEKLQVKTSRRTILNYEKARIMPGSTGVWRSENGKETYYSFEALAEFYASWKLIHGEFTGILPGFNRGESLRLTTKFVSYVRTLSYELESVMDYLRLKYWEYPSYGDFIKCLEEGNKKEWEWLNEKNYNIVLGFARIWREYKVEALTSMVGKERAIEMLK